MLAFSPRGRIAPDLGTGIGDKGAHAVYASVLGALLALAFPQRSSLLLLLLLFVAAAAVELLQPLVGRGADVEDAVMTVLGSCLGFSFMRLVSQARAVQS